MTRKFKGFTLIELIVAIAIFGIIMVGIMNLAQPITTSSATAKVANNQKNVEEATVSYIGENVRYATNLVVIEGGAKVGGTAVSSVKDAVDAFYKFSPVDVYGRLIDDNADNRKNISVIVWDGRNGKYSYVNHNYTGRLLAKTAGENPDSASLDSVDNYSATSNMYEVFGNDYYGPSNVYMNVSMSTGGLLKLECDSQYFKSNAAKAGADLWTGYDNGSGSVSGNATVGTFELRNMGKGDFRFYICGNDANTTNKIAASPTATGQVIYFVFTEELDALSIASTAPAAAPTYKDLAYDFGAGASNYVESKANSGTGGTNSGSGSSETGSGSGGTPSGGIPSGGTPSGGTPSGGGSGETKTEAPATEAPATESSSEASATEPTQAAATGYTPSADFTNNYASKKTANQDVVNNAYTITNTKTTVYTYHVEWNGTLVKSGSYTETKEEKVIDLSAITALYPSKTYTENDVKNMTVEEVENLALQVAGLPNSKTTNAVYDYVQYKLPHDNNMSADVKEALQTYFSERPSGGNVEDSVNGTWINDQVYNDYDPTTTNIEKVVYKNEWTGATSETPPAGY